MLARRGRVLPPPPPRHPHAPHPPSRQRSGTQPTRDRAAVLPPPRPGPRAPSPPAPPPGHPGSPPRCQPRSPHSSHGPAANRRATAAPQLAKGRGLGRAGSLPGNARTASRPRGPGLAVRGGKATGEETAAARTAESWDSRRPKAWEKGLGSVGALRPAVRSEELSQTPVWKVSAQAQRHPSRIPGGTVVRREKRR